MAPRVTTIVAAAMNIGSAALRIVRNAQNSTTVTATAVNGTSRPASRSMYEEK